MEAQISAAPGQIHKKCSKWPGEMHQAPILEANMKVNEYLLKHLSIWLLMAIEEFSCNDLFSLHTSVHSCEDSELQTCSANLQTLTRN